MANFIQSYDRILKSIMSLCDNPIPRKTLGEKVLNIFTNKKPEAQT